MSRLLRTLDELLFSLRREGFPISTSQALDAARALALVGFSDRARVITALEAVLVGDRRERPRFRRALDELLAGEHAHAQDLFGRLRHAGFAEHELDALRELLGHVAEARAGASGALALRAVLGDDGELETLLRSAGVGAVLARMHSARQAGYFAQQVASTLGTQRAASALIRLRGALVESLGEARGAALHEALRAELERLRRRIRAHVEATASRRDAEGRARAVELPLATSDPAERAAVRRVVRALGEKLRGAERVRAKRARRGRVDLRRTLARASSTGGVPLSLARKRRRRDRPKLFVLADVSDSVRPVAGLFLELVAQLQHAFRGTRSFVFVRDVDEITSLLRDMGTDSALARVLSGAAVPTHETSSYQRALADFESRFGADLDKRTTLVVLGDGRTNYLGDGVASLRRLVGSVRALLWITPEGRDAWGSGDSAMHRYAEVATEAHTARTVLELELAVRAICRRR